MKPYSEKTAELMDQEVRDIVETVRVRTENILREHEAAFRQVAELLLDKEVIMADDLERILGPKVRPATAAPEAPAEEPEKAQGDE